MTFPHHHLDIGRRSTLGNRSKRSLWVRLGRTLATVFWSRCKNGNISNIRRRLSPISLCNCRDWESGDGAPTWKRPPLAGTYRIFVSTISSSRTGWLGGRNRTAKWRRSLIFKDHVLLQGPCPSSPSFSYRNCIGYD